MSRIWNLTDVEFVALWEPLREGMLPKPFTFVSKTPLYQDFLREKADCRARLGPADDIAEALEVLARPDVRVTVTAMDGRQRDSPTGCIRMVLARRADQAYLFSQLPGETIWHSGGFTVAECDPLRLAHAVVAELPEVGPGRLPETALAGGSRAAEIDYSYGQSDVLEYDDSPVALGAAEFLALPATCIGKIRIEQGRSKFGPRGIIRHELRWRDIADDGRYAISDESPPVAGAADAGAFAAAIDGRVLAVIRAIRDERR